MDIYLDIDGVLLTKGRLRPALHLREFLRTVTQGNTVYWLTSHCKGDADAVHRHLRQYLSSDVLDLLRCVKPTQWDTLKTEAIDFGREFRWFDDYLLEAEQEVLRSHGRLDSWVRIDLDAEPDSLLECVFALPLSERAQSVVFAPGTNLVMR